MADDRRNDHLYTINRDHEHKNHSPARGRSPSVARYGVEYTSPEHGLHLLAASPPSSISPLTIHNNAQLSRNPMAILSTLTHLPHPLSVQPEPPAGLLTTVPSQYTPLSSLPLNSAPQVPPSGDVSPRHNRLSQEDRHSPAMKRASPNPRYNRVSPKIQLPARFSPGTRASPHSASPRGLSPQRASPHGSATMQRISPQHRVSSHGTPQHRVSPQGTPQHRVSPQGTPQHHVSPQVTPQHRVSPQGTPQHHVSPQVTPHHRVSPHVPPQLGVSPHGTPQHRVSPHSSLTPRDSPHSTPVHRVSHSRASPLHESPGQHLTVADTHQRGTSPLSIRVSPLPGNNSHISPSSLPTVVVQAPQQPGDPPPPPVPVFHASGLIQINRARFASPHYKADRRQRPRSSSPPSTVSHHVSPDVGLRTGPNLVPAHNHASPPRRPPSSPLPSSALPEDLSMRPLKPPSSVIVNSGGHQPRPPPLLRVTNHNPESIRQLAPTNHHAASIRPPSLTNHRQAPMKQPVLANHSQSSIRQPTNQSAGHIRQPALLNLLNAPVLHPTQSANVSHSLGLSPNIATTTAGHRLSPNTSSQRIGSSNTQQHPSHTLHHGVNTKHQTLNTQHHSRTHHSLKSQNHAPNTIHHVPNTLVRSLTSVPVSLAHYADLVAPDDVDMPRLLPQRTLPVPSQETEVKTEPVDRVNSPPVIKRESGLPSTTEESSDDDRRPLSQPYNMRVTNLEHLQTFALQNTFRSHYRTHSMALLRAKTGSISNPAKSLDILRQNLQKFINDDLDKVIQGYIKEYFEPAMNNMRSNLGETETNSDQLLSVCRQILEESKKLYSGETKTEEGVTENNNNAPNESRMVRENKRSLFNIRKRRGSSDSDASVHMRRKKGRPALHRNSGRSTPQKCGKNDPVKREGPKWDPDRLDTETQFVMGAKANKALGFGATRGRLYIKHPDLFKYAGDQDDKAWLYEHGHMPATGGKTYLLLISDIQQLADLEEYKSSGALQLHELVGFTVPDWMVTKMQTQMRLLRTDSPRSKARSQVADSGLPFSSSRYTSPTNSDKSGTSLPPPTTDLAPPPSISPVTDSSHIEASPALTGPTPADSSSNSGELSPTPSDLTTDGAGLDEVTPLSAPFDIPIG